jgi:hypothetical protein
MSGATKLAHAVPDEARWYRSKWPWLLMAAPAFAVFGGVATLLFALSSSDGLVADDYYKRGLAINQTLSRDHAAAAGHYRARVMFNESLDRVRVVLSGDTAPAALTLRLVHPTRAGRDRVVALARRAAGVYEGALEPVVAAHWSVSVEDSAGAWRLSGSWLASGEPVVDLTPN